MAENAAAHTGPDNLSKLLDELLLVIISSLPMKDAVRSSVLSKRWRYLYASRSDLEFDFSPGNVLVPIDVMNAVDRMLFYRKSCSINKFRIRISNSEAFDPCRLEGWIKMVICHGIREISLSIDSGLVLPSNLFTCKTLVELSLSLSTEPLLEVPAKVFLPSLKVLSLDCAVSFHKDDDGVERLLSNCPALESFECCVRDTECRLVVSNPTLKYLSITDYKRPTYEGIGSFEISINAPNLVSLFYYVFNVESHRLINVQSLSEATVSFSRRQVGNVGNYALAATDLIRGISGVRSLCIAGKTLDNILELNVPIPVFRNTTYLDITEDTIKSFAKFLHILTFFESLESLCFEDPPSWFDLDDDDAFEESRPSCLSLRLKKIELFQFHGGTCQMKMAEYFLENAKVLEVLETHIYEKDCEEELEITKKLLMLPRASEKCKVVVTRNQ